MINLPSENAQHLANYIIDNQINFMGKEKLFTPELLAQIIQDYWDSLL